MTSKYVKVALLAGFGSLFGAAAQAAPTFDFVSNESAYTLAPDTSVTIQIYLRETLASGDTSRLAAEDGLFAAVATVAHSGSSPTTPALITGAARDSANFNGEDNTAVTPTEAMIGGTRSLSAANGTPILTDSASVRRVSVGSLTIKAGSEALETTTFQLFNKVRGNFDNTLTWTNGDVLDEEIVADTFTITTTPEPASAGAVLAACTLLLSRKRRRPACGIW